jgi:hypothetical protein
MSKRLPDSWILKIFNTMQAHYGTRWMNMWKLGQTLPNGLDVGMANAMETWAIKLGSYEDNPEALKKVMQNLPLDPPSLPQFMDLLKHCHVPQNNLQLSDDLTEEQKQINKQRIKEILNTVCKKV